MVTELRVHGVTGTPAQDVLDRPLLCRVAGDEEAGFFRPRPEYGATTGPGGVTLEAYRWGNLTAGAAARALWLLLLPFMFANVALWLRPALGRRAERVFAALCRIFALSVTATFVLSFAEISVDLVGWQCASLARCLQDRPYFSVLDEGLLATTSRRLGATALVPALAIGLLWFLGRRTWTRYEGYEVPAEGAGDGLAHPCFWNGKPLVGRLRAAHIAIAFGTLDAVLLGVLVPHDRHPVGVALAVGVALLMLLCLLVVSLTGYVERDRPAGWATPTAYALSYGALLLTAMTLAYTLLPRDPWTATGRLPAFGMTVTVLFAAQAGLLLVLGVFAFAARRAGAVLLGLASPIVAAIALGTAAAFSAGLSYRVADFLDRTAVPSDADYDQAPALAPPSSYEWAAVGFVVLLALIAIVGLAGGLPLRRRLRRRAQAVVDKDFPDERASDPRRAAALDVAVAGARLTDFAGRLLGWVFVPAAAVGLVVVGLALAGFRPVRLAPAGSAAAEVLAFAVNLGTYLIGLATLGLLVLGLLAYRYQRFRRVVGVLWDLGTFWPRAAHPLAPPCYAERAVPELVRRATWLAADGGVILSGHSQGSVLALATALQLPPHAQARTALLTYGSPVRRLYARFFPAYVDERVLARVGTVLSGPGQRIPRWVNLWRDTDPIGGRVESPVVRDERLVDPPVFGFAPGDTVFARIDGHSGYQQQPGFAAAVEDLLSAMTADPPVAVDGRRPPPAASSPSSPAPPPAPAGAPASSPAPA